MTAADQLREQGRQRGLEQGLEQGAEQARREMLLDLLHERFGALPDTASARVAAADLAQLREWSKRALKAPTLDDVLGR